jgi:signal peptidase I
MKNGVTSVTHKIISIYENYGGDGTLGFQTKGVNNTDPDPAIVQQANVIGKVIFVLPVMGTILASLAANVYVVFLIFGLCILISFCLRSVFVETAGNQPR